MALARDSTLGARLVLAMDPPHPLQFSLVSQVGVLWGVIIGLVVCQVGALVMGSRAERPKAD